MVISIFFYSMLVEVIVIRSFLILLAFNIVLLIWEPFSEY
jgi:hypothetical protein